LGARRTAFGIFAKKNNLRYKIIVDDDEAEWTPERKKQEGEIYIRDKMALGYSREQAIEILTLAVEWLESITKPERTIKRPPAIYSNPTREDLIDKVLKQKKETLC
jgi:hypothetical protein